MRMYVKEIINDKGIKYTLPLEGFLLLLAYMLFLLRLRYILQPIKW